MKESRSQDGTTCIRISDYWAYWDCRYQARSDIRDREFYLYFLFWFVLLNVTTHLYKRGRARPSVRRSVTPCRNRECDYPGFVDAQHRNEPLGRTRSVTFGNKREKKTHPKSRRFFFHLDVYRSNPSTFSAFASRYQRRFYHRPEIHYRLSSLSAWGFVHWACTSRQPHVACTRAKGVEEWEYAFISRE